MLYGLIAVIFVIIIIFAMYNNLIRKKNAIDNAYGSIDSQLKKRYDLIPNLVSTVKQYAEHEKELLTNITNLRTKVLDSNSDERIDLDNQISQSLRGIMVAVENYPELKANENFINLQKSLNEVESQIAAARRAYNSVVTEYNIAIESAPQNIVAGMMKLTKRNVFEIPDTERENIDVGGLFNK